MSEAITLPEEAVSAVRSSSLSPSVQAEPSALWLDEFPSDCPLKWGWACRSLPRNERYQVLKDANRSPVPGDVALVQLVSTGYHTKITTADQSRMRLYPSDVLACVFGNRYATDAYEGTVETTESLHLLTGAGMIGTVQCRNTRMKAPTKVEFLGYLANELGELINLKRRLFTPKALNPTLDNVILLVGTGMNSGKTTTAVKLVKSLLRGGMRVASCKLTGSVSHNDLHEMTSTVPHDVRDFSDYGFPSTYRCNESELIGLMGAMLSDAALAEPDLVVMEIADGLLQRETELLLKHPAVRKHVRGVIHTAACASSALFGAQRIASLGHRVLGVSGLISSSPLFMREFREQSDVPLLSSVDDGEELAALVLQTHGR